MDRGKELHYTHEAHLLIEKQNLHNLEISNRSIAHYGFFKEWKKTLPKATHQCDLHDHAL